MSTKLKGTNLLDREKEKLLKERYENIQLLFTVSFVITGSLLVFDLVSNIVLSKPVEAYFYLRFCTSFFGLYGILFMVGGNICKDNFDIEFTCCCGTCLDKFCLYCGCHIFFGGLLLISSYCVELCSLKVYYDNKDKFEETLIVWLLYLLFFFSSITMILYCFLVDEQIRHIGYFSHYKKEGYGASFYEDESYVLIGKWKDDLLEGPAIYLQLDKNNSNNNNEIINEKIVGMFKGEMISMNLCEEDINTFKNSEDYHEMTELYKNKFYPDFIKCINYNESKNIENK